jgi:hypothetical protein
LKLAWLEGPLLPVEGIHRRIKEIIPEQLDARGWVRREMGARIVFVMLYGCAVEGRDRWIRPTAVTDMTDSQAARQDSAARIAWLDLVQSPARPRDVTGRWYGENTREPIRDESLRGMLDLGVALERQGIPTTSPKPRYALTASFAQLFDPQLSDKALTEAISEWQQAHLSRAARARVALARKRVTSDTKSVLVTLPNGEVRRLAPGPSSSLSQAAIESFAPRFLAQPAVILLSESAHKMAYRDEEIATAVGLHIEVSATLPDVLLADLGVEPPLLVFVECVASDGPVSERRKAELHQLAAQGGYTPSDCALVTVFHDRTTSPFRSMANALAWGSFVWFETEPDHLVYLREGREELTTTLADLLRSKRDSMD